MSREYENSFGPGFDGSELAYADWRQTSRTFVVSCDEAVSTYGLFPDQKARSGPWSSDERYNRKFFADGVYVGAGGALVNITQYVDKRTGAPMIEEDVSFFAVGTCRKTD